MFFYLFTLSIVLILYKIYKSTIIFEHWKKKGVKYVKPLPFVGNMLPTVLQTKSMSELTQEVYNAFPDQRYTGFFQFVVPVLMLRDPELIKSLTIRYFEHFADHSSFVVEDVDPLWAKNLFSSKGTRWRDLRQTLSPVFTSSKMRAMYALMDECAHRMISYLKTQNNFEIEIKDLFSRYTTDIIASTAFGIKCDSLTNPNNEFLLHGHELADMSGIKKFKMLCYNVFPTISKLFQLKFISTKVGNFFTQIIEETLAIREKNDIQRLDLLHLLMLARKGKLKFEEYTNLPEAGFATVQEADLGKSPRNDVFLTNEDITAQALVFFLGGFDTVSALMSFTAYELAVNPDVQKKLRQEILEVFQLHKEKVSYEALFQMKYLDMVICETLRKWPQATWIDRKCTQDFFIYPTTAEENTVKIKKDDVLWIPIYAIHNDPKYYPNPNKFNPERFSDENKEKIIPGSYLPFGIGPRNCIGSRYALLETKNLFYYLLLNFELVPTKKTKIPLKLDAASVMAIPKNGFHLGLKKINKM